MPAAARRLVALAAALALLAGCGGGGAHPATTSARRAGHRATAPSARAVHANEAALVPVLEYHRIGGDPHFAPEWTISTARFRSELEFLYRHRYRPITFRDFVEDRIDVPAGTTPVVLTFDDSSDTQFTYVRRHGRLVPDPHGAVGVLVAFHRRHPDWLLRGSFYVLPEADRPNHLFDQDALATRKLRFLVASGFEVGSHTLYHQNLAEASPELVREQLARSVVEIQRRLPGYPVRTMSVPFGAYPRDVGLLARGSWHGHAYAFEGATDVTGGPSEPPYARAFQPLRVPRIQTGDLPEQTRFYLRFLARHPRARYVSDGDPATVSFPHRFARELDLARLRRDGKRVLGY